jgi:DNA-binding MarR family transcriptional regulator
MGPCSLSELSLIHPGHLSALTQMVDRLVAKKWVSRERSGEDRRKIVLALTARARRLLVREPPLGPSRVVLAMEGAAPEEAAGIADAMERVAEALMGDRGTELAGALTLKHLEGLQHR